jgi:hypothetical protein
MMKRCRCLGVKQTHSRHRGNDASDPTRIWAVSRNENAAGAYGRTQYLAT